MRIGLAWCWTGYHTIACRSGTPGCHSDKHFGLFDIQNPPLADLTSAPFNSDEAQLHAGLDLRQPTDVRNHPFRTYPENNPFLSKAQSWKAQESEHQAGRSFEAHPAIPLS